MFTLQVFFKGDCDFDPGVGMYNLTSIGGHDLFVHKMCQSYPMAFVTISDTVICVNQSTTFDGSNSVGANSFLWSFLAVLLQPPLQRLLQ